MRERALTVAESRKYPVGEGYDISRSSWLNLAPEPGKPELDDSAIPVPEESPFVTHMRDAPGGPYIVAPDSTDWVPPEALAVPLADLKKVEERVLETSDALKEESPEGQVLVPRVQREFLRKTNDPAAIKLLEVLERGVEAVAEDPARAAEAQTNAAVSD